MTARRKDRVGGAPDHRGHRVVAGATAATILAVLPVYLLGSMSVVMRPAIDVSEFRLGLAVSIYFGISAVLAPFGGRMAERIGPALSLRGAILCSATALGLIGGVAGEWSHVLIALVVAAIGNAVAQPTSNLALSVGVVRSRQGVALGVKQSAGSMAAALAGLAVPTIGATLGWRAGFLVVCSLALMAVWLVPSQAPKPSARGAAGVAGPRAPLLAFAVVAGCGVAAAFSVGSFYVSTMVARGGAPSTAGLALAVGGVIAVATQIGCGLWADRRPGGELRLLAGLFGVGSVGALCLASTTSLGLLVVGTAFLFMGGMGWPGVFNLAVISRYARAPGAATGVTTAGMFAGGSIGPFVVGWLIGRFGHPLAWSFVGMCLLLAAGGTLMLSRWFSTARRGRPDEGDRHGDT